MPRHQHTGELAADHRIGSVEVDLRLFEVHVEGVGAAHLPEREAHDLSAGKEDAALEPQPLVGGEGAHDRVVLKGHTLVEALAVLLAPDVEHIEAAGDQLIAQGPEFPFVFRLKAVAVVFLPVQGFAGIACELFGEIEIVPVVPFRREAEAIGILRVEMQHMRGRDAAKHERVAPLRGKGAQRLDRRAQGT